MKEKKNEKMSDDVEKKGSKGITTMTMTITVRKIPGTDNEQKRICEQKKCDGRYCPHCEIFRGDDDYYITVKELEDMFSDKEKGEFLRVMNVNDDEITDEMIDKTAIRVWYSVTLTGTSKAVMEAHSAL